HPKAKRLLVVAGDASYDRDARARALRELRGIKSRVQLEALSGLTMKETMARLSALDPDTVVLQLTVHTDAAGTAYVGRDVVAELSRISAAPMYTFYDTLIGHGVVGGNLMNREGQKPAIGEIARRLLDGESAAHLPIPAPAPAACTIDWRQVERWRIETQRIPSNCRVLFRTPPFWERHGIWLIAGALALLLQVAWLLAWRVQRQRRQKAEQAARVRTAELTHAARLGTVGGLMASITHEISQPLMSILTNAAAGERMIASGQPDIEEIRSILADIRSDDARAGAVISHLRELLKKREVSMEPVQINEVVAKALKIIESAARKHQIDVSAAFAEKLDFVEGDPVHLQQVILNLAMNGIEAMIAQTGRRTLTVRTTCKPQRGVEVAVSDTGCGIPPIQLARLFEPFYSTKPDGMGIGLSIAQTIVEAHGGRIWAESDDRGATVRFTIPRLQKKRSGASEAATARL
ncbi:MAG TPA: ATP-binding protein, partial [Steroidobacteraceae bacterium]|nr:ATP-binding protein [Steroidobacteraceae bacterium]